MIYFNHNRENCEEVRVNHKYINKERYKNMTIQIEKLTNAITVSGILLSADVRSMELEMEDKETGNKVKRPVVSGRLEIITKIDEETGSKSTETVEIFANKYTKNGTLNSAVETLEEILGGIKTNEEIKALKKKDPNYKNKVVIYDKSDNEPKKYYCSVWNSNKQYAPKFNVNRYVSQNEIKKNVRISGGNLTIKPFEEDRHKLYCDFELDCIVRNIQEELDREGNPTGRAILTVFAPVMNQKELDGVELKMYAGILPALEEGQEEVDLGSAFLDEVQEIEGWEKVVNSLASDYDVDLYVTGSNSRMMSSEISTYLTGRYVSFRIFPLSFEEYLTFRREYTEVKDVHSELADYIRLGGFPATHLRDYSQDEVYTIVRDIYNSTIFSDIVRRNQIRKVDQLERVVKYTFSNVGNTFSAKSISDYLK